MKSNDIAKIIIVISLISILFFMFNVIIQNYFSEPKVIEHNGVKISYEDYKSADKLIDEPFVVCNLKSGDCIGFIETLREGE